MKTRLQTRAFSFLGTLLLSAALFGSQSVNAGAYYLSEIGAKSLGRAGANIVNPKDPTAMWLNPAALANVKGLKLKLNGTFVFMNAQFKRDCGPNNNCGPKSFSRTYKSGSYTVDGDARADADGEFVFEPNSNNLGGRFDERGHFGEFREFGDAANQALVQPIPALYAVFNFESMGIEGLALGLGAFAPYAGDYRFDADEYTRYTLIDRDLLELFYQVTLAYRYKNWIALGASLQGVSAGVKQQVKLSADEFGNEDPKKDILVEIEAYKHFIPSANFGVWSNPIAGLEIGASAQLGRSVDGAGTVAILEKGESIQELIDEGAVVLNEDNPSSRVRFQLPPFYRVGVKYDEPDLFGDGFLGFDVELDFVYEQWSAYDHIALNADGVTFSFFGNEPEGLPPVIQPKNYQDSWSVRLGGEVNLWQDLLALRTGAVYETSAIPNETLSVDLLNGEKLGVGLGLSTSYWGMTLDIGYAHMFVFDRTVGDESIVHTENSAPGTFNPERRTRVAMGQYRVGYDMLSASVTVAFDELLGFAKK